MICFSCAVEIHWPLISDRLKMVLVRLQPYVTYQNGYLDVQLWLNRKLDITLETKQIVHFDFSHYLSMEKINRIKSSYPTRIRNRIYVEANVINMMSYGFFCFV